MKIVTLAVFDDEPCYGMREEPRMWPGPDGVMSLRWIQTMFVVRGDTIESFATDFGPAENFEDVIPLYMPSIGTDTVAQLREHGEKNRHDHYWSDRRKAMLAESTLISDHIAQVEQVRTYAKRNHRTVKEFQRW